MMWYRFFVGAAKHIDTICFSSKISLFWCQWFDRSLFFFFFCLVLSFLISRFFGSNIVTLHYCYSNAVAEPTNDCRVMFGIYTFFIYIYMQYYGALNIYLFACVVVRFLFVYPWWRRCRKFSNGKRWHSQCPNNYENLIKMCKCFERIYLYHTHHASCEHLDLFWNYLFPIIITWHMIMC